MFHLFRTFWLKNRCCEKGIKSAAKNIWPWLKHLTIPFIPFVLCPSPYFFWIQSSKTKWNAFYLFLSLLCWILFWKLSSDQTDKRIIRTDPIHRIFVFLINQTQINSFRAQFFSYLRTYSLRILFISWKLLKYFDDIMGALIGLGASKRVQTRN